MPIKKVAIGKFLSPFGVRGEIKIHAYSLERDHLKNITIFSVPSLTDIQKSQQDKESLVIEYSIEYWKFQKPLRCKINGYNTPEEVRILTGKDMFVDKQYAAPLKKDEYYIDDLQNMSITIESVEVGRVQTVYTEVHVPLLEIALLNQDKCRIVIIPFQKVFFDIPRKNVKDESCEHMPLYSVELLDKALIE